MNNDLFETRAQSEPLASKLRPQCLADYFGQGHLTDSKGPIARMIERGRIHSMILWGPPGVGKTTLAKLICNLTGYLFEEISAVTSGTSDIRSIIARAQMHVGQGRSTVLFVDEVHRFNKSQQDAFLPHVEAGTIVLVGATTENPSFEVNNALLSRTRVYRLKELDNDALVQLIQRAENEIDEVKQLALSSADQTRIATAAMGDGRRVLNMLEWLIDLTGGLPADSDSVALVLEGGVNRFDKGGDQFYDQISAFHKSVRGSNSDGALYWLACMIENGVDPLYAVRRLVAIASEDIGNADPRALQVTLNAWDAFTRLGSPEGELAIAHATVYCAVAPKSNRVYSAWADAKALAKQAQPGVPMHLRNAPTKLLRDIGAGEGYRYAHDEHEAYASGEVYLPKELAGITFYNPSNQGLEQKIAEKLNYLRRKDAESKLQRYNDADYEG